MDNNLIDFFSDDETLAIVHRYEDMKRLKQHFYFDVAEFEDIIDFYIYKNQYTTAFEVTKYASKQHPSAISIQLRKAQLLIDTGNPLKSLRILDKIEQIEKQNLEVFLSKGSAYTIMGKIDEAMRQFDHALSIADEATDDLLYNIALAFERIEEYDIAIRYLLTAFHRNHQNLDAIYDLAYCYEKVGDNEKSIALYEIYLDENPFSENAWYNLGIAYNKEEDFEKAIEAYNFSLAINPEYTSAYFNKANTYSSIGEYEKAIDIYKEFLKFEELDVPAYCYIAECYEKIGDNDNALKYYREALQIDEEYSGAWYGIGMMLLADKCYVESLLFIYKALLIDGDNVDYWFALTQICEDIKFFEGAKLAYLTILELDPFNDLALLSYTDLIWEEEKCDEAINLLTDFYNEKDADNALINYQLAIYLYLTDEKTQALFHLDKALMLDFEGHHDFLKIFPQATKHKDINELIEKHKIIENSDDEELEEVDEELELLFSTLNWFSISCL